MLKSRGVPIPEAPRAARAIATSLEKTFEAWFRAPDGGGTSAFTLGVRSEGRYRLVDVIVKAGTGIVSIAGMQISRGQLRDTFDEIEKRFGAPPAAVPIGWARARIALARAEHDTHRTPVPLGFEAHRDLLGPAPSPPPLIPSTPSRTSAASSRSPCRGLTSFTHSPSSGLAPRARRDAAHVDRSDQPRAKGRPSGDRAQGPRHHRARDRSLFHAEVRETLAARMKDAAISMLARGSGEAAADLMAMIEVGAQQRFAVASRNPLFARVLRKGFRDADGANGEAPQSAP